MYVSTFEPRARWRFGGHGAKKKRCMPPEASFSSARSPEKYIPGSFGGHRLGRVLCPPNHFQGSCVRLRNHLSKESPNQLAFLQGEQASQKIEATRSPAQGSPVSKPTF